MQSQWDRHADAPPMLETIRIGLLGGGEMTVDVVWQRGVWAVHKIESMQDAAHDDEAWTVTHIPTGCCLDGVEETMRTAIGLGLELYRVAPDFKADGRFMRPVDIPDAIKEPTKAWLLNARAADPREER